MATVANLSVIIPTYQRGKYLIETLNCLYRQTYRDFTIIIVIDGSTDNTEEMLKSLSKPIDTIIISQQNKGRAAARNVGARAASAKWLLFLDDDITFDEHLIGNYALHLAAKSIIVGVARGNRQGSDSEFSDYAEFLNKKWTPVNESKQITKLSVPYINAQNFMIEKELFVELGGFDERLSDAEDFDLAIKAYARSEEILLDRALMVHHKLQKNFEEYAIRNVQYFTARKKLIEINPNASKFIEPSITGIKLYIYALFRSTAWMKAIDNGVFKFFPQKMRFRLYSFLIAAQYLSKTGR